MTYNEDSLTASGHLKKIDKVKQGGAFSPYVAD